MADNLLYSRVPRVRPGGLRRAVAEQCAPELAEQAIGVLDVGPGRVRNRQLDDRTLQPGSDFFLLRGVGPVGFHGSRDDYSYSNGADQTKGR